MDDVREVARKLRRDARRLNDYFDAAERRLGGWRLCLSISRVLPDTDSRAEAMLRATLGEDFVREHREKGKKTEPTDALFLHCHLSTSWRHAGPPSDRERERLDELLAALGVPDDIRKGEQFASMSGPTGPGAQVTHWRWKEAPEAKA
jgi:hypothetical protein